MDYKAINCIFVGYCSNFKAYKMFNPSTHNVFASIYVIFDEHVDEGNKGKSYEEWNMSLLIDDNNDQAKDNHLQQQQKEEPSNVDKFNS